MPASRPKLGLSSCTAKRLEADIFLLQPEWRRAGFFCRSALEQEHLATLEAAIHRIAIVL